MLWEGAGMSLVASSKGRQHRSGFQYVLTSTTSKSPLLSILEFNPHLKGSIESMHK